jgi:hypothetical protein
MTRIKADFWEGRQLRAAFFFSANGAVLILA